LKFDLPQTSVEQQLEQVGFTPAPSAGGEIHFTKIGPKRASEIETMPCVPYITCCMPNTMNILVAIAVACSVLPHAFLVNASRDAVKISSIRMIRYARE